MIKEYQPVQHDLQTITSEHENKTVKDECLKEIGIDRNSVKSPTPLRSAGPEAEVDRQQPQLPPLPCRSTPQRCLLVLLRLLGVRDIFLYFLYHVHHTDNTLLAAVTALEPLDTSQSGGGGTSLTISDCEEILTDAHLGDSIAVNGTIFSLETKFTLEIHTHDH